MQRNLSLFISFFVISFLCTGETLASSRAGFTYYQARIYSGLVYGLQGDKDKPHRIQKGHDAVKNHLAKKEAHLIDNRPVRLDYVHTNLWQKGDYHINSATFKRKRDFYLVDYYMTKTDDGFKVVKEVLRTKNATIRPKVLWQAS